MRAGMLLGALGALSLGFAAAAGACTSVDCADERVGQVRCVGNQVERCTEGNALTYEGCGEKGLVCSAAHAGCVTEEVANATTSNSGSGGGDAGGAGGVTSTGMGGTGGGGATGGVGGTGGS